MSVHLQVARHALCQLLAILRNAGVQVDGGGVLQARRLLRHCCVDCRVAVAHRDGHDACERLHLRTSVITVVQSG